MTATISAILAIVGPIFTYLAKKLIDSYISKDQLIKDNEETKGRIVAFNEAALRAVRQVDIEFVKPLKDKGTWSNHRMKEAKRKAIEQLADYYGPDGLTDLTMFFDINADTLWRMMEETIEAAIFQNRGKGHNSGSMRI